jgi:DNA-binding transcriptional ArsR family regulator
VLWDCRNDKSVLPMADAAAAGAFDLPSRLGYGNQMVTNRRSLAAMSALADPMREAIVRHLARGECSVGELAEQLPVTRPAVSKHLRLLQGAGLVRFRSEGTRNVYALEPEALAALRDELDGLWRQALARFALVADNNPRRVRRSKP